MIILFFSTCCRLYWTAGKDPVNGSITDADGNGTETLTRTLQHNYTSPVTVTYTITPKGPGATACPGASITRTVIVEPTLVITSPNKTICNGTSTALTISTGNTTSNPMYYTWTVSGVGANISGASSGGANGTALATALSQTLTNSGATAQTVTYDITPWTGTAPGYIIMFRNSNTCSSYSGTNVSHHLTQQDYL